MFWRHRKVLRDRAAGMVFDWRKGHGSSYRLVVAIIVSASFWGAILAYIDIREVIPLDPVDDQIDVTIVDLDAKQYRGLAELIDRETLFQQRWDTADSTVIDEAVVRALVADSPRIYEPTLREISMPAPETELLNLPGMGPGELPTPDPVELVVFATPPVNWWVEVGVVEGPEGLAPFAFPFEWPDEPKLMSEGELWSVVLTADWRGRVVAAEGWWEKVRDRRTQVILEKVRSREITALPEKGPLRVWRLEARVVNRPLTE
ncbi:MAG: hypothetical protein ACJAVK_003171 [Akkermansiaceae bacterium]|jgi:hypothetical protein